MFSESTGIALVTSLGVGLGVGLTLPQFFEMGSDVRVAVPLLLVIFMFIPFRAYLGLEKRLIEERREWERQQQTARAELERYRRAASGRA
jgi:hypothetical protein